MTLVASLELFLQEYILQAKQRRMALVLRPILVGPPSEVLSALFDSLTSNGTADWHIPSLDQSVVVLSVLGSNPRRYDQPQTAVISQECHWDYAVNVRNSCPIVVMLVDPSAWDTCPESLINTTEILGAPRLTRSNGWFTNPLWKSLLKQIRTNLNVEQQAVRDALNRLLKEADALDVSTKSKFLWTVANDLLSSVPDQLDPDNALAFCVGFPSLGTPPRSIPDADKAIQHLGDFIRRYGLRDGFERLKNTLTATNRNLISPLDDLQNHITERALSGITFSYAPIWFYRPKQPVPSWWTELSVSVLDSLLEDAGDQPISQLNVTCENAINRQSRPPKEPLVVMKDVHLRTATQDGSPVRDTAFERKVGTSSTILQGLPGDNSACVDTDVPAHDKPIKYIVHAAGVRNGAAECIALASFGCHGHARVRDAESNPPPTKDKRTNTWRQEITLSHGGTVDITIFCAEGVAAVKLHDVAHDIKFEGDILSPAHQVSFVVTVEGETTCAISLYDRAGVLVAQWAVGFTIQDNVEAVQTRFEALMKAHREKRTLPIASMRDAPLLRLEDWYLQSADSWTPVVACWASDASLPMQIDWRAAYLGNVRPSQGLPPPIKPPADLAAARESVRTYLLTRQRCIEEMELDDVAFGELVDRYLRAFSAWISENPEQACWLDTIAVYAAIQNIQAGDYTASDEPVSVVLSPLHPLKIGWQALAQQQLSGSLSLRCPAAGLLTPSTCPDIGGWSLDRIDQNAVTRAFFAVPCDNPYWAVLMNRGFLARHEEQEQVLARLAELGLATRSITGGFTQLQAMHSIQEISRLLPGRATLRIGIIGSNDSSAALSEGVLDWCKEQLGDEHTAVGPLSVDIFDLRDSTQPSPGALAVLSEETHENARWYRVAALPPSSALDVVILDHLGSGSPSAYRGGLRRSVVGSGSLYRTRIRQDFNQATTVVETRIARRTSYGGGLAGVLLESAVAFEELALSDEGTSHFQLRPNQQAIGQRLKQSTYLAVTSSQLDPGGVIRGVTGQEGYLWDYELPGILGGDEESAGFYLLAKPLQSMKDAISSSASLITAAALAPEVLQSIIQEISRRGIPVLKRLASGGSQSRGELGLLLATRLLQNAFVASGQCDGLPVWSDNCIHLILPVDPYEEPFESLRVALATPGTSGKRPDLLVIAIKLSADGSPLVLKLTPVEVKFRGDGTMPPSQLKDALDQASNLAKVLYAAWSDTAPNDLWSTCSRALLAECLDFAFRIYAGEDVHRHTQDQWAAIHETVLEAILSGEASVTLNKAGRLIVFDASAQTSIIDIDSDGLLDTIVVCKSDAKDLLLGNLVGSARTTEIISALDFSFPACSQNPASIQAESREQTAPTDHEQLHVVSVPLPPPDTQIPEEPSDVESPVFPEQRTTAVSPITDAVRQQVSQAFDGFIGNESAVRLVKNDILRALIETPPHLAKNFLFSGEPSTGKTELARRIAEALRLPFVRLDGRGLVSRERLFELVNGELAQRGKSPAQVDQKAGLPVMEYPPLIIFVDEVHLVPKPVQESLLTALEAVDRTVTMESFVAKMTRTTFLFATTRPSDVDRAFRSRCTDVTLQEYSTEEVAEMIRLRFPGAWPDGIYTELARLGRRVPRVAIGLAKDLETQVLVAEDPGVPVQQHLEEVKRLHNMDDVGLKPLDYRYLEILAEEGRPVGEQAIINMLSTADKDRVTDEVEPFLRKLGFIRFISRGREITNSGTDYLLEKKKRAGKV